VTPLQRSHLFALSDPAFRSVLVEMLIFSPNQSAQKDRFIQRTLCSPI
jgi:hypothetical protein